MPEAGFEPARLSTTVFETAASAVPPLRRRNELYLTSAKTPKYFLTNSKNAEKHTEPTNYRWGIFVRYTPNIQLEGRLAASVLLVYQGRFIILSC